ncbi:MAG: DsbA family protein [Candidatus Aenigmarchaeota archaeon]|nr:DsbA family protein [Candidatus Aenigmarchaeota archaeon]
MIGGSGKALTTGQIVAQQQAQQQAQQPAAQGRVQVSTNGAPLQGDANAKVTIIEFSDFQCPFCERFYTQTLPQIETDYIKTGKVNLVFRNWPLPMHEQATPAANAIECAEEQGKFWEYHNKLFENQQSLGDVSFKQWAADLGLDTTKFNSCYDSKKFNYEIQQDLSDGSTAGVTGTPTFFIGNPQKGYQAIVGACPYSTFDAALKAELAGKDWSVANCQVKA